MLKWNCTGSEKRYLEEGTDLTVGTDPGMLLVESEELKEFRETFGLFFHLRYKFIWTGRKFQGCFFGSESKQLVLMFQDSNRWITCKNTIKSTLYMSSTYCTKLSVCQILHQAHTKVRFAQSSVPMFPSCGRYRQDTANYSDMFQSCPSIMRVWSENVLTLSNVRREDITLNVLTALLSLLYKKCV